MIIAAACAACVPTSRLREAQAARIASQQALEALTEHLASTKREHNKLRDQYNALETFSTQNLREQQQLSERLQQELLSTRKNHSDEIARLQQNSQKASAEAANELSEWRAIKEKRRVISLRNANMLRTLRDSIFLDRDTALVQLDIRENALVIGYRSPFLFRPASRSLERPARLHLQSLAQFWQTNNDLQLHIYAFLPVEQRSAIAAMHLANEHLLVVAEFLQEQKIAPKNVYLHTQFHDAATQGIRAPIEIHLTLGL